MKLEEKIKLLDDFISLKTELCERIEKGLILDEKPYKVKIKGYFEYVDDIEKKYKQYVERQKAKIKRYEKESEENHNKINEIFEKLKSIQHRINTEKVEYGDDKLC